MWKCILYTKHTKYYNLATPANVVPNFETFSSCGKKGWEVVLENLVF